MKSQLMKTNMPNEIAHIMEIVTQEFKLPLVAVSFNIQSIKRLLNKGGENTAEQLRTKIETIEAKANHMSRLLEHIMDLAKTQISDIQMKKNLTNTHDLISEVITKSASIQGKKNIQVDSHNSKDFCTIVCDKDRLTQVFISLISCLMDLNSKSETIKISTKSDGHIAQFKISDETCTVDRKYLNSIFEKFWHTKNKNLEKVSLGLALTKTIIEAHCGKVWVESNKAFGMAFYIELPIMNLSELKALNCGQTSDAEAQRL